MRTDTIDLYQTHWQDASTPIEDTMAELLTGKMKPGRRFSGDDLRIDNPRFSDENIRKVNGMLNQFQGIAEAHRATIGQLVIAWTLAQPGITFVLCGARNPDQVRGKRRGRGGRAFRRRAQDHGPVA